MSDSQLAERPTSVKERWLDIPGWAGYYQVSDMGRVRSVDRIIIRSTGFPERHRGVVLSLFADKKGYLSVGLTRNNKRKTFWVHLLVASAFMPDFCAGTVKTVDHIDQNKSNAKLSNLIWRNHSGNLLNRPQRPMGSNAIRGVTYDARYRLPWKAHMGRGNIIGRFASLEEAASARAAAYSLAISNHLTKN